MEKLLAEFNIAQIITIILQLAMATVVFIKLGKWKPNQKAVKEMTEQEKKLAELKAQMDAVKAEMKPVKEKKLSNAEVQAMILEQLKELKKDNDTAE